MLLDYTKLIFIIPNPNDFHSGGNLYNAALINALKKKDLNIEQITLDRLRQKEAFYNEKAIFLWDTLYFDQLDILNPDCNNWLIVHHLESLYSPKGWTSEAWFDEKERKKLEKFDGFLVSSPFTKKYLQAKGFDKKQIVIIPPALLSKPVITRRKYESIQAIMVANLQERKGVLPFLEILVAKGEKQNFKLTIIGNANMESGYAQKCLNLIQEHPFLQKCIHFKGALPPVEVLKMYEKSNLYISTSFMETFGMSMQEAAASGMPLLIHNGGNAAFHVKNRQNGVVFEDMECLVEGLFSLIKDEKKCVEMGNHAFDLAKEDRYDWAAAVGLFLAAID